MSDLPTVGTPEYRELCSAFYLGLAGLQSGEDVNARKGLTRATEIAPGEPAAWLDLGLLQFRQQDFEGAYASVARARSEVATNSRIEALLGIIQSRRGNIPDTLAHLSKAVSLDRRNLKAAYALAQETERQGSSNSDAEAQKLLEQILQVQPNNIAVLVDLVRISAKRSDAGELRVATAALRKTSALWPPNAKQQLLALQNQAAGTNVRPAAMQAQFLRNVLVRVPAYRQSLDEVKTPVTTAGEPFLKFLRLPAPRSEPDPLDRELKFSSEPLDSFSSNDAVLWLSALRLDDAEPSATLWADTRVLHVSTGANLALPGVEKTISRHGVTGADLNYDFKVDLAMATEHGLRIYRQRTPADFDDVTSATKLPPSILSGCYYGVWAFDVDLDGDLDLILASNSGEPLVLRNNGDGSFLALRPFKNIDGLADFAVADVDGDGDPDVAIIDRDGEMHVFMNQRLGDYRQRGLPSQVDDDMVSLAAADVNGDGVPDFLGLRADGHLFRLSDGTAGHNWTIEDLLTAKPDPAGLGSFFLADLDNNGAMDLIIDRAIYLGDGRKFTAFGPDLPVSVSAVLDSKELGRLDLIGFEKTNPKRVRLVNSGSKHYGWQQVRTRAAKTGGDQRMNSFGIGGEMEIRAGLLTEKQMIGSPVLHFGIGSHTGSEFARIVWPNGLIQTEFGLKANQQVLAEQRLKGSCPFLFTWNGSAMEFVKDVGPMSAALGAHELGGTTATSGFQTEEWFKIAGDQLKARDGFYDVRIADEYWETYFMDSYALLAVDHPPGTQIYVDERVSVPAAPLRVFTTTKPLPFFRATDDQGRDVTGTVTKLDGKFVDGFSHGTYAGIAHDHWVELTLPPEARQPGSLYLVADGWLHPWDDSTLMAASQNQDVHGQELSIEIPDATGSWQTIRKNLGVPAGRNKTVVFDLTGLFGKNAETKLRLRSNLEIYWDRLAWARDAGASTVTRLRPDFAELHHRGFSVVTKADASAPEIPHYHSLAATGERWPAISGYYTRFGDVLPLLAKTDDRYVIARSGDELRLRFPALPPASPGVERDYVLVSDGWMKEGDRSFAFSDSVQPLPYHAMKQYGGGPLLSLEQEAAYRLHPDDWQLFHTRYIENDGLSAQLWERR